MESAKALFSLGPLQVNSQMVTLLVLAALLVIISYLGTRHMEERPKGLQNLLEKAVEFLLDFFSEVMGPELARRFLPYLGTMFLLILFCNYSGLLPLAGKLPGLAAPTSMLSVTAGLALCTFFVVQYTGFHDHGLKGYSHHFTRPIAVLCPLFLLEEIVHPVSLSLRLFGNIFGEETVTEQLAEVIPVVAPLAMNVLSLLMGAIQALVFTLLSSIYISMAASEGH
ncbi:MAG: F0F1 ATP synthase subunit A [Firmicutes bacterium]|nr:F0F1 ATP synthase subunit A [Bacillota bacterium]